MPLGSILGQLSSKASTWAGRASGAFKGYGGRAGQAGKAAYEFAGRNQRALLLGGGATYGYASGEGDFGDRAARAAGFAFMGGMVSHGVAKGGGMGTINQFSTHAKKAITGTGILTNKINPNGTFRRVMQGYVKKDGQFYRKTMGVKNKGGISKASMIPVSGLEARGAFAKAATADMGKFFGIDKWSGAHSMVAGGIYGMISQDVGVVEGVLGGGFVHGGAKIARSGLNRTAQQWGSVRAADGIAGKAKAITRLPMIQTATGAGLAIGGYAGMDEQGALGVTSSAVRGALVGGGVATIGKASVFSPSLTLAALGGTGMVAGGAVEAYSTWEATGRPGMHDMEADGDLTLSLHRLRHGF